MKFDGDVMRLLLLGVPLATVFMAAMPERTVFAQTHPPSVTTYDGLWQVDWRCEANAFNGAGPIVDRFRVRLSQGQFTRVTEGTTPQQRTWRQAWGGRVDGSNFNIIADGSDSSGVRWQYRQSGQFASPTTLNLTGGGFVWEQTQGNFATAPPSL